MRSGRRTSAAGLLVAGLLGLTGCQGSGRVELAVLDFGRIDPPAPRISTVRLQRCYWWTDEEGQVWIALERDQPWLLGPERFIYQMSLVLEALPAGPAREYLVNKRELRALARFGPAEARFVSLNGIVALYRASGDRLRGSLRLHVRHQAPKLLGLGGWTQPKSYLMMGTFEAVHDEVRGRRIATETESQGWDREPPASQPTTAPAP